MLRKILQSFEQNFFLHIFNVLSLFNSHKFWRGFRQKFIFSINLHTFTVYEQTCFLLLLREILLSFKQNIFSLFKFSMLLLFSNYLNFGGVKDQNLVCSKHLRTFMMFRKILFFNITKEYCYLLNRNFFFTFFMLLVYWNYINFGEV